VKCVVGLRNQHIIPASLLTLGLHFWKCAWLNPEYGWQHKNDIDNSSYDNDNTDIDHNSDFNGHNYSKLRTVWYRNGSSLLAVITVIHCDIVISLWCYKFLDCVMFHSLFSTLAGTNCLFCVLEVIYVFLIYINWKFVSTEIYFTKI